MDSSTDERLMDIVDEYVDRVQRGDCPSIDEYCQQNPDIASELRELLAALGKLDELQSAQTESTDPASSTTLQQVGDYRIVSEIGRGGMGIVYEAEQESLGRRVALKVLPRNHLNSATAESRFQREARAAARMHHTNIVPVFEVGQEGDIFFYAMQLIAGQSLDEIIDEVRVLGLDRADSTASRTDFSRAESTNGSSAGSVLQSKSSHPTSTTGSARRKYFYNVSRIARQAADALAYAHERGVVHRDIKPSNLLLDVEGVTWITDFGLAKVVESDEQSLTRSGDYLGTLRYMSPERFQGQCDERSDIYALGLTLYELAVLKSAFSADDRVKLIYEISNTDPVRPRTVNAQVPRDLETIILKCIEKEPARRYQSAAQLTADLTRFLNDEPILARRLSIAEQALRWTRRNTSLAAAFAAIALLLTAIAIISFLNSIKQSDLRLAAELEQNKTASALKRARLDRDAADKSRQKAEMAEAKTQSALRLANNRRKKLQQSLYATEMNRASLAVGKPANIEQLRTITDKWKPVADNQDLRNWEWFFLRSVLMDDAVSFGDTKLARPTLIANNTQLAAIPTDDKKVQIFDTQTGQHIRDLVGHEERIVSIAWDDVRQQLVSLSYDSTMRFWNTKTGECLKVISRDKVWVQKAIFTTDRLLVFENSDSGLDQVRVIDADTYETITIAPINTIYGDLHCASPAGNLMVTHDLAKPGISIWSVESGELVKNYPTASSVVWNTAGDAVEAYFVCLPTGEIQLFQGSKRLKSFRGPASKSWKPFLSKDRKTVISGSTDNTVRIWDYDTQEQLRIFQGHRADLQNVIELDNGEQIVSQSHKTFLWRAEPAYVSQYNLAAVDVHWHPDSNQLAVIGDGQLSVIDVKSDTVTAVAGEAGRSCRWSSDGRFLAMEHTVTENSRFDSSLRILDGFPPSHVIHCDAYHSIWNISWHPTQPKCFFAGNFDLVGFNVETETTLSEPQSWNPDNDPAPWSISCNPQRPNLVAHSWANSIYLRDLTTNTVVKKMHGHNRRPQKLEWSPNGKLLASASADFTARIWDADSGFELLKITSHNNQVMDLAWNNDNKRLATCGSDGTVRVWDVENGNELFRYEGHHCEVSCVAWSPDGLKIASGSIRDNLVILDASRAYAVEPKPESDPKSSVNPESQFFISTVGVKLNSKHWTWTDPVEVSSVNTIHDEYEPTLSTDGLTLMFHSDRPEGQGGTDLWQTHRASVDSDWQTPVNAGPELNSSRNEESPELSADGLTVFFASARSGPRDLWFAKRATIDAEWQSPVRLPPPINGRFEDIEPAISPDGCTMVFASTRPPKHGIFDLWMTTRNDPTNAWSEPIHLSKDINHSGWHGGPTLAGDGFGSTLVYHTAIGSYTAHRTSPTALFEFAQPLEAPDSKKKLGSARSPFLTSDGQELWFRRLNPDTQKYDLWRSRLVPN